MTTQYLHINLKWIALSLIILFTTDLFGQNQEALSEAEIQQLLKEAEENWHRNIPQAKKTASMAFHAIDEDTPPALKAEAYAQYGISFYTDLKYDSAFHYFEIATKIAIDHNLDVDRYLATTASAMEKTGRFMDVINLIDKRISQVDTEPDVLFNLLRMKLSASISSGLSKKSDSIISILDTLIGSVKKESNIQNFIKLKGRYYNMVAQFDKSDSAYAQLLSQYKYTGNQIDEAEIYLLLAQNAMEVSQFNQSSELLFKARSLYDSMGYEFGKANVDLFTGSLLSWMGEYKDASNYIFNALEVFQQSGNQNQIMIAYYELGWIFYSMKLEERAKKYLTKSLNLARKINNYKYLGSVHNAFGSLYIDLEKYDSAINSFDSAIYYENITQNTKQLAAAKFNKALVLEEIGNDKAALKLYRESYSVDLKLNNFLGLVESERVLGEFYLKKNQLDSAQYYFILGEKNAKRLGEKYSLLRIYESLAALNSKKNNHKVAKEYLEKALATQKALAEENKAIEIATLETTYDLKNKEKELTLLNLQKQNNEQTIALNQKTIESQRRTLIILVIGIIALLILSYIIFRYLKIRTKTNHQLKELNSEIQEKQEEIMAQSEELKEANDQVSELNAFLEQRVHDRTLELENALSELDHFFYRASHDFRGPLTTLLGLVGISKTYDLSEEAENLFSKVNITVRKLDGMVQKLQSVSLLGDLDNLKTLSSIHLEKEIKEIADEAISNETINASNYNCELKIKTGSERVIFYPAILSICLSNLIENSLVFNHSREIEISVTAIEKDNQLIITVEDNGIGISQDMQAEIFSMFKRTSQISTGNGLGLYIVKKAVDKLKGQIQIDSKMGEGCKFTLSFPLISNGQISTGETERSSVS